MSQSNTEYYMKDNKCNRCLLLLYTLFLFSICITFIFGILLFIINYDKFKRDDSYLNATNG